MGHVVDRWTVPNPAGGRPARVKGPRWGKGKRWAARWVDPAGIERLKSCSSKDAALAYLAEVDVAVREGRYVGASRVTFEAYARDWLSRQVHQRPGTAATAKRRLERHPIPELGPLLLTQITRADCQRLVVAASRDLAPSTVRLMAVYTRAVLSSAVEDRLIKISPWRRITLPQVARELVVPLTAEQVLVMADRLRDGRGSGAAGRHHRMEWARRMFLIAAQTGVRPGELRGLTVDRLSEAGLRVDRQLVDQSPTWGPLKTDASPRTVPLAPGTARLLREQLDAYGGGPGGLIFHRDGVPVSRHALAWAWDVASAGMGLPKGQGWHQLRHHHASLLIAAGLSPRAVADRLGHADVAETLRTYAHLWPSDSSRIVAAIEAAYDGDDDR